jgi:hypothetical protein
MVAVSSIVLAIFIPAAMSLIMVIRSLGSLATLTRLSGYFSMTLLWVLLSMVIYYFNGLADVRSHDIAAQFKIIGEPSLVFLGLWFGIYLRLPPKTYQIVS